MITAAEQERTEAIGEQLRQKIASKFTASAFLAGFALTVLTGQVFALWQPTKLPITFAASIGIVFAAFISFIEAVIRLDELTMPKRFWVEVPQHAFTRSSPREGYLTDDDLWNLQNRMIFLWTRLTLAATAATLVAVLAMVVPFQLSPTEALQRWCWASAAAGILLGLLYNGEVRRQCRKRFPALTRPVD